MKLLNTNLLKNGFILDKLELPVEVYETVISEDWEKLDQLFKGYTTQGGELYRYLRAFHEFNEIEFIISIRSAKNEYEEDGIWHDDGSRIMAFSLSLTIEPPEGGILEIRKKGEDSQFLPTPHYSEIIVFLTGQYGFEHKINAVTKGKRIIIAGWCS